MKNGNLVAGLRVNELMSTLNHFGVAYRSRTQSHSNSELHCALCIAYCGLLNYSSFPSEEFVRKSGVVSSNSLGIRNVQRAIGVIPFEIATMGISNITHL